MNLEDFFPKYPNIHKVDEQLLNPYAHGFRDVITSKKEFADLKLEKIEEIPTKPGTLLNHQKIIARFLSSNTPYNELLLYHEMGTGKTCTAIGCIEQIRKEKKIKGALVFARGEGLLKNFVDELLFKCTDGRYIPENYDSLSDLKKARRVRKMTKEFYTFDTFEVFAKHLRGMSDSFITQKYSNHVIVIDEVHNIRLKTDTTPEKLNIYTQFNRFLHLLENSKVLLMSGTPIKDVPEEIANVMNLILPKNLQFNPNTFTQDYLNIDGGFKPGMETDFVNKVSGRISYLKAMGSEVQKIFMGKKIGNLKYFKVWETNMSDFQSNFYREAYMSDQTGRSIYSNSRQASLFVYPDGSYGSTGSKKYISKKETSGLSRRKKTHYVLSKEVTDLIMGNVNNLRKYSCKYADLIENIIPRGGKMFIYCEYVEGSGAILLGLLLQHFGFTQSNGTETTYGKRYAVVTNITSTPKEIKNIIEKFNSYQNKDGDLISIIIGSRVISEGYTLKGVASEVILTPHWNYSETEQAIARGWRIGAHSMTPNIDSLKIYQTVAKPDNDTIPSIDLNMYEISERKDLQIKAIEHAIKISAFDCSLFKERNAITGYDGMRECDYTSCDYKCLAQPLDSIDIVTYNLYYTDSTEMREYLKKYFRRRYQISIEELKTKFPNYTEFEVIKSLKTMVDDDTVFMDRFNMPQYIRVDKNIAFICDDPSKNADYYTSFYTKNIVVEVEHFYLGIINDIINETLSYKVDQIFKYPYYANVILQTLPFPVQLMLLKSSLLSLDKGLTENVYARNSILNFFKGQFVIDDDQYIINLINPPICLPKGGSSWGTCDATTTNVSSKIPKEHLESCPIGYYGMYNPTQKHIFCLKEIQPNVSDLRKVKVGKKCDTYDKPTLLNITAGRIKLQPPINEIINLTRDQLLVHVRAITAKLKIPNIESLSDDELRAYVYWNSKNRAELCDNIRKWMTENNFIEENLNCGIQQKVRSRAIQ